MIIGILWPRPVPAKSCITLGQVTRQAPPHLASPLLSIVDFICYSHSESHVLLSPSSLVGYGECSLLTSFFQRIIDFIHYTRSLVSPYTLLVFRHLFFFWIVDFVYCYHFVLHATTASFIMYRLW